MRKMSNRLLVLCFALFVWMQPLVSEAQDIDTKTMMEDTLETIIEPQISEEDAFKIAKEFAKSYMDFDINDDYDRDIYLEDYSWYTNTHLIYQIYYSQYNDNYSKDIDFQIDAMSGEVVSFSQWEYDYNSQYNFIPKLSYEEARVISDQFLQKIQPEFAKEVMLDEADGYGKYPSETYGFQYVRVHNGIPFDSNYISIDVDGMTGKINYYSYSWDTEVEFIDVPNMISSEEAYQIIADSCTVELNYMEKSNLDTYETEAIVAIYEPSFGKYMIHAKDGSDFEYTISYWEEEDIKDIDLSTDERKSLEDLTLDIPKPIDITYTTDEANEIAMLYKEIIGITDMEVQDLWQYDYGYGSEKVWSVQLQSDSTLSYAYSNMDIDALTGKLNLYSRYDEDEYMLAETNTKEKVSWEEAYYKAVTMAAMLYPNEFEEIITKQIYYDNSYYYNDYEDVSYRFSFSRSINGIEYYGNSIDIEIGVYSGNISSIYYTWDELEFPKFHDLISEREAINAYLNNYESYLLYVIQDYESTEKKAVPVYILDVKDAYQYPSAVNAKTGEVLDYWGQPLVLDDQDKAIKLEGHWAEKELTIMQQLGIADLDVVGLQNEMTVTDYMKMLVNALEYSSYYVEYEEPLKFTNITKENEAYNDLALATYYGLIENEAKDWDFEKKLNREEMAMYMIKMLGHQDLAQFSSIYKVSFSDAEDISRDLRGYVAIGEALGILEGEDGKFYPKRNVTYEEAIVALYNLLIL